MTMFLSEQYPRQEAFANVTDPALSTFVFAGLGGRFDIGPRTTEGQTIVASR